MGFLDKLSKHKKDDTATQDKAAKSEVKQPSKKDKKLQMSSVLDESVPNAAVSDLKNYDEKDDNHKLKAVDDDGNDCYITLLLNADDIGGINASRKNDRNIGGLIEEITNNTISTYIPEDLLEKNELLILPTDETIDALDEFEIIQDPSLNFKITLVYDDGHYHITNASTNLDSFKEYQNDENSTSHDYLSDKHVVHDKIEEKQDEAKNENQITDNANENGDANNDANEGISQGNAVANALLSGVSDTPVDTPDDSTPFGNSNQEQKPVSENDSEKAPVNELTNSENDKQKEIANNDVSVDANDLPDEVDDFADEAFDNNDSQNTDEASNIGNQEAGLVIDDESNQQDEGNVNQDQDDNQVTNDAIDQYNDTIKRKFYGSNLDLTIDSSDFDGILNGYQITKFDENRGTGMLNEYLNNISRQANHDLTALHQKNVNEIRQEWFKKITDGASGIIAAVDEENEGSKYYNKRQDILTKYTTGAKDVINRQIKTKQDEIEKEFENNATQAGEDAKNRAIRDYKDRHRGEYDERKKQTEIDLNADLNNQKNQELKSLEDERNNEAARNYDELSNKVTKILLNKYQRDYLAQEQKVEDQWRKKIKAYIKHHQEDQTLHDKALYEEIQQEKKVKALHSDYEQKINDLTRQLDQKIKEYDAELKRVNSEKQVALDNLRKDNETHITNLIREKDSKIDNLTKEKNAEIETLKRDHQTELELLTKNKDAKIAELVKMNKSNEENQKDELDTLVKNNQVKIDKIKKQYEEQVAQLNDQNDELTKNAELNKQKAIDKIKEDYESKILKLNEQIDSQKSNSASQLDDLNNELELANARNARLNKQLKNIDAEKEKEFESKYNAQYQGKINTLEEANRTLQRQVDNAAKYGNVNGQNKSDMWQNLMPVITVLIIMIFGGGMFGYMMNHNNQSSQNSQAVASQIKQAKLEQKNEDEALINKLMKQNQNKTTKNKTAKANSSSNNSNNSADASSSSTN